MTRSILLSGRKEALVRRITIAPNLPGVSAVVFSVLFFALILALCIRESAVVDIVGKVLTPLLLAGLAAIIIKGIVRTHARHHLGVALVQQFPKARTAPAGFFAPLLEQAQVVLAPPGIFLLQPGQDLLSRHLRFNSSSCSSDRSPNSSGS